jgi:hypothetical protein
VTPNLRLGTLATAAAAITLMLPAHAAAAWGPAIALAAPQSRDVVPTQVAFASGGEAAVGFGEQDPENAADSSAFVALRSPAGRFATARQVPHAQQVLGLAFARSTLELLAGSAPGGRACCATVRAVGSPSFSAGRTLVSGLTGITDGQLASLRNGALLAAIATDRGVWVAQSGIDGRFHGRAGALSFAGAPTDLAVAPLGSGGGAVAWTTAAGRGETWARRIVVASGSSSHAPSRPRAIVSVPQGHSIDELALAPGSRTATLAWVESWYDAVGRFRSVVRIRDLGRDARTLTLSSEFELAAGITFAGSRAGGQVLSWESCSGTGACFTTAALRDAGHSFGQPQDLGAVDPSEAPAAAIESDGTALVAWTSGGRVLAVTDSRSGAFNARTTVSTTTDGANLTVAAGPHREALAAWTEGAAAPAVRVAAYAPGG